MRNCIAVARHYQDIPCNVDCVDILDFAIEKLYQNAAEYGVASMIRGVVCLVINSEVQEMDKSSGEELSLQFEVNLLTEELQELLKKTFEGWEVFKESVRGQQYDIPRDHGISALKTNVVTFVARKE